MRESIIELAFNIYEAIYPYVSISFLLVFFVLIPLGLFNKTRVFAGNAIYLLSLFYGFGIWIYSVAVAFSLASLFWLIVGILLFGVGVVFIAVVALFMNDMSDIAIAVIATAAVAYLMRYLGLKILEKADN